MLHPTLGIVFFPKQVIDLIFEYLKIWWIIPRTLPKSRFRNEGDVAETAGYPETLMSLFLIRLVAGLLEAPGETYFPDPLI